MWGYQRRLSRDLERWAKAGWVSPANAELIRADVAGSARISLPGVLAILASVLFCFAVMSFVASHWTEIPRLARLGLLFGLLWAGYLSAAVFESRNMTTFRDAGLLVAVGVFGATIMLISQMFHIEGHMPDGILMWWVGALGAGVVLRSNPVLALTMVLVCVWSGMWMAETSGTHWPFLIGWTLVTAAFAWQRWWPGAHLSAFSLASFIVSLTATLHPNHSEFGVPLVIGLACAIGAVATERRYDRFAEIARVVLIYAALAAFAGLFGLQFLERQPLATLVGIAALTLFLLYLLIWYGVTTRNRGALWVGYIAFSVEIFALYIKTAGTMLNTSLFFLIAALIFAALAAFAWRLHNKQLREAGP